MQFVFVFIRALRVNINKRIDEKTNILPIFDLAFFHCSFINKPQFFQYHTACNISFFYKSFKTVNVFFLLAIFNNFFRTTPFAFLWLQMNRISLRKMG